MSKRDMGVTIPSTLESIPRGIGRTGILWKTHSAVPATACGQIRKVQKMTKEENKQALKTHVNGIIWHLCAQISSVNGEISYNEGKSVIAKVKNLFNNFLGYSPSQVDAAGNLALVFIAPTMKEKMRLLRRLATVSMGMFGLASIIGGIATAAGWGMGILAAVKAWFLGTSLTGPIGFIAGGATLIIIATYFHFKSDGATSAEKFEKCLMAGLDKAIDAVWIDKGGELSEKMVLMANT